MKISIIIPVFNSGATIEKNILSILNQSYSNLEIIYINDGSSDNSENVIKHYLEKDNRINYKAISNHGVSYARNIGISLATGKYICFIDSDDVVDKDFCCILINNLIKCNSEISICDCALFYNDNISFPIRKNIFSTYYHDKYKLLLDKFNGYLCNKLYIAKIIKDNNINLNENIYMCEDLLFNFYYFQYVNKIAYTNDKLYGYVMKDNSSKKISNKWFSIFYSYEIIYSNFYSNLSICEKDNLDFYFLSVIFEAKVRCEIANESIEKIISSTQYKLISNIQSNWRRLLKSKNLSRNKKFKLISYYNFYFISKLFKKKKLLGG